MINEYPVNLSCLQIHFTLKKKYYLIAIYRTLFLLIFSILANFKNTHLEFMKIQFL